MKGNLEKEIEKRKQRNTKKIGNPMTFLPTKMRRKRK